nr:hypothetical protein [Streptomyces sp. SJL17-1]
MGGHHDPAEAAGVQQRDRLGRGRAGRRAVGGGHRHRYRYRHRHRYRRRQEQAQLPDRREGAVVAARPGGARAGDDDRVRRTAGHPFGGPQPVVQGEGHRVVAAQAARDRAVEAAGDGRDVDGAVVAVAEEQRHDDRTGPVRQDMRQGGRPMVEVPDGDGRTGQLAHGAGEPCDRRSRLRRGAPMHGDHQVARHPYLTSTRPGRAVRPRRGPRDGVVRRRGPTR